MMLDWLFQLGDQIPDAMDPVNPKFSGTRLSSLATRVIRQLLVKKKIQTALRAYQLLEKKIPS